MLKSVTDKGAKWEWLHSLWMFWIIIGGAFFLTGWAAFLYVGFRVQHRRWMGWGAVYTALFFVLVVLLTMPNNSVAVAFGLLLWLATWAVSVILAIRIRREYLVRLQVHQQAQAQRSARADEKYRQLQQVHQQAQAQRSARADEKYRRLQEELSRSQGLPPRSPTDALTAVPDGHTRGDAVPDTGSVSPSVRPDRPGAFAPTGTPTMWAPNAPHSALTEQRPDIVALDINSATEQKIAQLPGVGLILAKQAIAERNSRGGFRSLEEFGDVLRLKPHIVERIRPLVTVGPMHPSQPHQRPSGRTVDF